MAFRYINPGYVSLLADTCSSATEVTGTAYSKTGVGFSHTKNESTISLPKVTANSEIFIRFDAYIPVNVYNFYVIVPFFMNQYGSYTTVYFNFNGSGTLAIYAPTSSTSTILAENVRNVLKIGKINSCLIRLKCGNAGESVCEVTVNGEKFSSNTTAITYSSSNAKVAYLYSTSANAIFSNVIISDSEISPKEQIIALSPVTTLTDMAASASGIYVADAANQFLLQSVDVSTLIEDYGASSVVTGIALVGNPAYKTATGLAALTSLSRAGTSTIEHGTVNLSDDTSAVIVDGWTTEDMTIADLQNMQFGWKAGT